MIGPDREEAVVMAFEEHETVRAAAREAGVSFDAARRVLFDRGLFPPGGETVSADTTPTEPSKVTEDDSGARRVEFVSDRPVRTLDDALAYADVDLFVWRVRKWECTGWQVGMKLRAFESAGKVQSEAPVVKQLWRVSLSLERILPKSVHDATEAVFARMKGYEPKYPRTVKQMTGVRGHHPHLCVMDLVDVHFGKLAWAPETGQNYDLKIADRVYRDAVDELLGRSEGFDVDEFLVPLGSDFLHIDGLGGMTTNGTPQDVDGRIAKILTAAELAVIWAVEAMAERGRVVVRWVPGNHDRLMSYCLARTVAAWFRSVPRVTVDVSPAPRKYHHYHGTLIGLTHGDEERHSSLPALMATEAPDSWADSNCREWHVGHLHKSKRLDFLPLDTHNGVPVRTLRSLSATDAWHFRKGYVGSQRAAEAYLYSAAGGYVGHFCANVRDDQGAA